MKSILIGLVGAVALTGCVHPQVEKHRNDSSKPVVITNYYQVPPNTAGGVKLSVTAYNMVDKKIKYFDFWANHYDRVGERQRDTITGQYSKGYRFTGPFSKEQILNGRFGPSFYNFGANCMTLTKVVITYMDNSILELSGKSLEEVVVLNGARCRNLRS